MESELVRHIKLVLTHQQANLSHNIIRPLELASLYFIRTLINSSGIVSRRHNRIRITSIDMFKAIEENKKFCEIFDINKIQKHHVLMCDRITTNYLARMMGYRLTATSHRFLDQIIDYLIRQTIYNINSFTESQINELGNNILYEIFHTSLDTVPLLSPSPSPLSNSINLSDKLHNHDFKLVNYSSSPMPEFNII